MKHRLQHHTKLFFLAIAFFCLIISCSNQVNQKETPPIAKPASSDCRLVKHELGESCIPQNPQRIIVTDESILDPTLALGFQPIAAAEQNIAGSRGRHFGDKAKDIVSIGKTSQFSIERIVELQPDLILGFYINPEIHQLLSETAPTLKVKKIEPIHLKWKQTFVKIAEKLDRKEQAQTALNKYQQRVDKLRQQIKQKVGDKTVSVMRFYASGRVQVETIYSFSTVIIQELGLSLPPQLLPFSTDKDTSTIPISLERVDLVDADVLFVMLDPDSEDNFKRYQSSPLWKKLNVVENNRVYTVDSNYWYFGNILAANAILDDLEKYLLGN